MPLRLFQIIQYIFFVITRKLTQTQRKKKFLPYYLLVTPEKNRFVNALSTLAQHKIVNVLMLLLTPQCRAKSGVLQVR